MTTCPGCGAESEKCYRCSECGRDLADTEDHNDRELMADGGTDLDELPTHDLVGRALEDLGDQEATNGIPTDDVVGWVTERTELEDIDVQDAIESLHNRGHIYEPGDGRLRRTDADDERWSR